MLAELGQDNLMKMMGRFSIATPEKQMEIYYI